MSKTAANRGLTPMQTRLVDANLEILGEQDPRELAFLHTVLASCSLPYRELPAGTRDYIRENGAVSLIVTAGRMIDPKTEKPTLQGIPYGAKPRLLMIHLCTEAVRTQSPKVAIADSMTAFMQELGLKVSGGKRGSIAMFKEQLNRLAAAQMQLFVKFEQSARMINPAPLIRQMDVWFPDDARQKMLWPSEVTLSQEFFETLQQHALPLDQRAVRALQHSARAIDCYTWLAHRLPRVKATRGDRVSWQSLQTQFGADVTDVKTFKRHMLTALRQVKAVYPGAKFEQVNGGLILKHSSPPISKKIITIAR